MESLKKNFRIAQILASAFMGSASKKDIQELDKWKEEGCHETLSRHILAAENYKANQSKRNMFNADSAWKQISDKVNPQPSFSRRTLLFAAASVLLVISFASYFLYQYWNNQQEILPGTTGAVIILANGESYEISPNTYAELHLPQPYFSLSKEGIVYTKAASASGHDMQNTLFTQKGMEYRITLSDGSKIHLNAESQLTYPVCFDTDERIVQLKGEAYFEIATDTLHPFIVQTSTEKIRVTGTTFNVRAYSDERQHEITLIKGGVTVDCRNKTYALVPNDNFTYNQDEDECHVKQVNADLYTSWNAGAFIFKNVTLENVMSYLSKWYGFNYSFADENAKQVSIGAYLNRYQTMTPILKMIEKLNLVNIKKEGNNLTISTQR